MFGIRLGGLQVELNTIASSFGSLSTLVSGLHKHILERAGRPDADLNRLPPNNAAAQLADALGAAAAEFGNTEAAVLFVVQPNERNSYDQQVSAPPRLFWHLPVHVRLAASHTDAPLVCWGCAAWPAPPWYRGCQCWPCMTLWCAGPGALPCDDMFLYVTAFCWC